MLRAHTEAVNAAGGMLDLSARIINTQDLFHGALLPAAILLLLCAAVTWCMDRKLNNGNEPGQSSPSRTDWMIAAMATLLIVGLLGGVALGYLYAVEAAASGGVALLLFGLMSRTLTRDTLKSALQDTMAITGALFALLIGATVFTLIIRAFGTDRWLATSLATVGGGAYGALAVGLLILAGCALVLDAFEMIFVVIPLVIPPLLMRVPDATWVAVLTLLVLQASFLIPPFGYSVLMVRNRTARRLDGGKLAKALLPYLAVQLCVFALVLLFPRLVWHDEPVATAQSLPSPPVTDDALKNMLDSQTNEQKAP